MSAIKLQLTIRDHRNPIVSNIEFEKDLLRNRNVVIRNLRQRLGLLSHYDVLPAGGILLAQEFLLHFPGFLIAFSRKAQ
ncbi:hypothetical protein SAMN05216464_103183 [Mucilaginibacter pineti]|uniref:Uncharacterized protein n=1 Tax=Mucilaginibacter pineti TaxID=1391627 RepID=A0A1G6Z1C1_9SPHI|nr:hypothetical protein SAMN05216464_103183 [Mucilaginibacter pineti]